MPDLNSMISALLGPAAGPMTSVAPMARFSIPLSPDQSGNTQLDPKNWKFDTTAKPLPILPAIRPPR